MGTVQTGQFPHVHILVMWKEPGVLRGNFTLGVDSFSHQHNESMLNKMTLCEDLLYSDPWTHSGSGSEQLFSIVRSMLRVVSPMEIVPSSC